MVIKVIAKGFILNDYTYLRNPWNWLDFIVILSGKTMLSYKMYPKKILSAENQELHSTKNLKHIFPGLKLCGLVPNFYIHVSLSDLCIYSHNWSSADRSWEYINRSQIHESGNWETEQYNDVAQFHFWEFINRNPDIYIAFSPALHLQCRGFISINIFDNFHVHFVIDGWNDWVSLCKKVKWSIFCFDRAQSRQSAKFFSSRRNWDSHTPSPAGKRASLPLVPGGGGTLAKGRGGGEVPIPKREHPLWYSVYICTLCGLVLEDISYLNTPSYSGEEREIELCNTLRLLNI